MVERWIVAPKVEGSSPSIYPLIVNLANIFKRWTMFENAVKEIAAVVVVSFFHKTLFLSRFYLLSELIWQDAFLIDFAQKKTLNKWTQKFLTVSSYLFNERLVFDFIVRFVLDFFLIPLQKLSVFEVSNTSNLLTWLFGLFIFFILLIFLFYLSPFFL